MGIDPQHQHHHFCAINGNLLQVGTKVECRDSMCHSFKPSMYIENIFSPVASVIVGDIGKYVGIMKVCTQ